jgi:hypothetical protein
MQIHKSFASEMGSTAVETLAFGSLHPLFVMAKLRLCPFGATKRSEAEPARWIGGRHRTGNGAVEVPAMAV